MASSPRYRRNGNIKSAVGNTSEKQTLKSASVIQFNKSAAVLATVKGKSLRDGLRLPLTAAARSGQRKLGWDEEMVAVRSNNEMVRKLSVIRSRKRSHFLVTVRLRKRRIADLNCAKVS